MKDILDILDKTIEEIIIGSVNEYSENMNTIGIVLLEKMPSIIRIYFEPDMHDLASEAQYWPALYERIIKAIEDEDLQKLIDVLYFETYLKILELKEILDKRGIKNEW